MFALVFGVLFAVSFLGFSITSRSKYSAASHLMRRMKREQEKAHTVTYNLTQAQLDAIVQEKIGVKIAENKKDVYEETVNTVLALVLTLPLEVLMDHYWPKSYRERLPGFVDKVLEYYGRWENGELDMDKLKEDLWEYGGIRLEPAQIDMEDEEN